jgi:hypothetical protein
MALNRVADFHISDRLVRGHVNLSGARDELAILNRVLGRLKEHLGMVGNAADVLNERLILSDDEPSPVGAVASPGTAETISRSDHHHVGVHQLNGALGDVELALEEPAGDIDGVNVTYTVSMKPILLFKNGIMQLEDLDWTWVGGQIVYALTSTPQPGNTPDWHRALVVS